jgi:outer membrane protein assembly factor BamB
MGNVPIVRSLRVSWAVLWKRGRTLIGPIAASAIFAVVQGGIQSNVQSTLGSEPVQLWHVEGVGRGLPAADSSTAYFLTKQHEVLAVDMISGAVRWRRDTGVADEATWGSRLVLAGSVIVAGDYDVVAFDRTNGALRWRFSPVDGYGPGIYLGGASDGLAFTGSPSGRVYAVDDTSGDLRWSALIEGDGTSTVFQPAADRDLVVAGYTTFTAPARGGIVALDISTGHERWRTAFPRPDNASLGSAWAGGPLPMHDLIVAASSSGEIYGFDRRDGSIRWSLPRVGDSCVGSASSPSQDFRPLSVTGRTLVAGSLTGCLETFNLDTRLMLWRHPGVDNGSVAFSIVADNQTAYVPYVGGRLRAFNVSDGKPRWEIGNARRRFNWPPALADGRMLVASAEGFFAFRP